MNQLVLTCFPTLGASVLSGEFYFRHANLAIMLVYGRTNLTVAPTLSKNLLHLGGLVHGMLERDFNIINFFYKRYRWRLKTLQMR